MPPRASAADEPASRSRRAADRASRGAPASTTRRSSTRPAARPAAARLAAPSTAAARPSAASVAALHRAPRRRRALRRLGLRLRLRRLGVGLDRSLRVDCSRLADRDDEAIFTAGEDHVLVAPTAPERPARGRVPDPLERLPVVVREQDGALVSDDDHAPVLETLDGAEQRSRRHVDLLEALASILRAKDDAPCADRDHRPRRRDDRGHEVGARLGARLRDRSALCEVEVTRGVGRDEHAERAIPDPRDRLVYPRHLRERRSVLRDGDVAVIASDPYVAVVIGDHTEEAPIGLRLDRRPRLAEVLRLRQVAILAGDPEPVVAKESASKPLPLPSDLHPAHTILRQQDEIAPLPADGDSHLAMDREAEDQPSTTARFARDVDG